MDINRTKKRSFSTNQVILTEKQVQETSINLKEYEDQFPLVFGLTRLYDKEFDLMNNRYVEIFAYELDSENILPDGRVKG